MMHGKKTHQTGRETVPMETEMNIKPAGEEPEQKTAPETEKPTLPAQAQETEKPTPEAQEAEPEVQPPQDEEQHPRRRRRPVPQETEEETYYPMDRCCICSHPLDTGCAILFTDDHGMARIDENCCTMLEAAARSMDQAEVARAFDYFAAWLPYVKQPVADYLRDYLRVVQTFLNS